MRFKWLVGFLTVLFFVSFGVLIILTKRPICIDSTIVEKIDRLSSGGTLTAYQCNAKKWIPYDEKFQESLPEIARKIANLERFFSSTAPLKQAIAIVWLENTPGTLRLQDKTVFISEDLLLHTSNLEESLIRLWVRQTSPQAGFDRSLLEGTMIDIVLYLTGSSAQTQGSEKVHSLVQNTWPTALVSGKDACQKASSGPRYLLVCEKEIQESDFLLVGSGRAILSSALILSIKDLSLSDSTELAKGFAEFLKSSEPFGSALLSEGSLVASSAELRAQMALVAQLFQNFSPAQLPARVAWQKWMLGFSKNLKAAGFLESEGEQRLEHLLVLGADQLKSATDLVRNLTKLRLGIGSVAVQAGSQLWFLPSTTPINPAALGKVSAHQVTYISCELPNDSVLGELEKLGDRLLLVQECGDTAQMVFSGLVHQGYAGFAHDNAQVRFLELHVPSMPSALKASVRQLWPNFAQQKWTDPRFKALGWTTPQWDDQMHAFRARSVIDAIQAFR